MAMIFLACRRDRRLCHRAYRPRLLPCQATGKEVSAATYGADLRPSVCGSSVGCGLSERDYYAVCHSSSPSGWVLPVTATSDFTSARDASTARAWRWSRAMWTSRPAGFIRRCTHLAAGTPATVALRMRAQPCRWFPIHRGLRQADARRLEPGDRIGILDRSRQTRTTTSIDWQSWSVTL